MYKQYHSTVLIASKEETIEDHRIQAYRPSCHFLTVGLWAYQGGNEGQVETTEKVTIKTKLRFLTTAT